MEKILIILCLLLIPSLLFAGIDTVSGTISNGETVTITGTNFGSKSTAAPNLFDAVDNISSYSSLSNGDSIPYGGSHPWSSDFTVSTYGAVSGEQRHTNSSACYKESNNYKHYVDGRSVTGGTGIYVSWWFKTDTDVSGTNHSSKYLRLSQGSALQTKTLSWAQILCMVYDEPSYAANNFPDYAPSINTWHFLELFIDNNAKTFTAKADNTVIHDNVSWSSGSITFDYVWKVGFDGGGVSPPYITSWIDDIYVDNTQARVVLGDASTYSTCDYFEVQPAVTWATGKIEINFNQGSFVTEDTAYLYVVSSTGTITAGKLITIDDVLGGDSITTISNTGTKMTINASGIAATIGD